MSNAIGLHCQPCNNTIPESQFRMSCEKCGNPLDVRYDLDRIKTALMEKKSSAVSGSSLKIWQDILPIDRPELIDRVSIGETQTPLVKSSNIRKELGVENLRFKMEMGPTQSLKDRGTSLCALKALELGFDTMCVASSGNNAASIAAYAAKAGIPAVVFIQKDTSPAKIYKVLVYGARVVRVNGDMSVAGKLCDQMKKRHQWMESGGPNPYRLTAKRTATYEIYHQLDRQAPDALFIPCGGSAGIVAASIAFTEMVEMGLISTMPKLIGVQLSACDPITQAYKEGRDRVTPVEKKPSFSDALMNNNPYWGDRALAAAQNSGGFFISVTDDEVADAIRLLGAREGLFTEPAGAASVAGLTKSLKEKRLPQLKNIVCMLTGHGLNAPQAAFDNTPLPELVEPEVVAVESYLSL